MVFIVFLVLFSGLLVKWPKNLHIQDSFPGPQKKKCKRKTPKTEQNSYLTVSNMLHILCHLSSGSLCFCLYMSVIVCSTHTCILWVSLPKDFCQPNPYIHIKLHLFVAALEILPTQAGSAKFMACRCVCICERVLWIKTNKVFFLYFNNLLQTMQKFFFIYFYYFLDFVEVETCQIKFLACLCFYGDVV